MGREGGKGKSSDGAIFFWANEFLNLNVSDIWGG